MKSSLQPPTIKVQSPATQNDAQDLPDESDSFLRDEQSYTNEEIKREDLEANALSPEEPKQEQAEGDLERDKEESPSPDIENKSLRESEEERKAMYNIEEENSEEEAQDEVGKTGQGKVIERVINLNDEPAEGKKEIVKSNLKEEVEQNLNEYDMRGSEELNSKEKISECVYNLININTAVTSEGQSREETAKEEDKEVGKNVEMSPILESEEQELVCDNHVYYKPEEKFHKSDKSKKASHIQAKNSLCPAKSRYVCSCMQYRLRCINCERLERHSCCKNSRTSLMSLLTPTRSSKKCGKRIKV
eukprot:TRINITY_DN1291_c0_g1_i1.p1 TRINITY_DN1291_c0_g1~~TRINITY_DN1291_c0_g1_i1.p1  ORF type:complete len:304 (+),score=65.72 TRINITY_DN1291_c0_g1_i1:86-997(+)